MAFLGPMIFSRVLLRRIGKNPPFQRKKENSPTSGYEPGVRYDDYDEDKAMYYDSVYGPVLETDRSILKSQRNTKFVYTQVSTKF